MRRRAVTGRRRPTWPRWRAIGAWPARSRRERIYRPRLPRRCVRVDLETWLSFPQPRMLSEGPHIAMVDGFLPAAACDWLIEAGRPGLKRAQVTDPQSGK